MPSARGDPSAPLSCRYHVSCWADTAAPQIKATNEVHTKALTFSSSHLPTCCCEARWADAAAAAAAAAASSSSRASCAANAASPWVSACCYKQSMQHQSDAATSQPSQSMQHHTLGACLLMPMCIE
eukprot:scaffold139674_cov16-Tisochrysis_lutea.AAC.2